ncbi:MAG TPA: PIN domain-containing protein [Nitrospirota bacterium]
MPDKKLFLDTNVLVYAYDTSAGRKHEKARDIMLGLWDSGLGVVSTQVLQEFFVLATRKIPAPLDVKAAKEIVSDLLKWDVVVNDGDSILGAIDIYLHRKYSFWDALIIEAAVRGDADILLSEDLSHGQVIHGVAVQNPFI